MHIDNQSFFRRRMRTKPLIGSYTRLVLQRLIDTVGSLEVIYAAIVAKDNVVPVCLALVPPGAA